MRRRSVVVAAGGLALVLLRRRVARRERVELLYDDGSLVRLDRGVDAKDLLRDAREIRGAIAP